MKRISFKWASLAAASAAIAAIALLPVGAASAAKSGSLIASYSGAGTSAFKVPNGVKKITIDLFGASGGAGFNDGGVPAGPAGLGGEATATLSVRPGQIYQIVLGGQGGAANASDSGAGGFNGGGAGSHALLDVETFVGGGGGGGSDVRAGACAASNGCDLHARILVAGGGGGAGGNSGTAGSGGFGGGYFGGSGDSGNGDAGRGGTQTESGAGGGVSQAGTFGQGGDSEHGGGGGGGGGGWYGGGGGDFTEGAGGGSGYILPAIFGSFQTGVQSGDGRALIYKAG